MSDNWHGSAEIAARVEELNATYGGEKASATYLLCDKWPAEKLAYRIVPAEGETRSITYGDLKTRSEKLASGLAKRGIKPGDRVATLMGKSEEFLVSLLAIWRLGAVHVPLFTAFAPPAIEMRLNASGARLVICDSSQRSKLDGITDEANIALSDGSPGIGEIAASGEEGFTAFTGGGEAPIIEIYTSGTTGAPKGVVIPLRAAGVFQGYAEFGLGLNADEVFWNAADPGWAYGLYYGIIASFATGVPSVLHAAPFSAEGAFRVLREEKVVNFAAAPTVYRAMRASGISAEGLNIRIASSAGEPLTPEVNEWAEAELGVTVHDHYGQTESGMTVNNHHHPALKRPVKSGAMGMPMPGWSMAVLDPKTLEPLAPGEVGVVAADRHKSPFAYFTGYRDAPEKTAERFTEDGRWYLTGDVASVDEDGYFRFSSRDDDIIIMAGYRIGPFDVESVLSTHPAVQESAAVALPDEVKGEVLVAAVVLAEGHKPSDALTDDLKKKVKTEFAAHAFPRQIFYVDALPKTPSGKIQRFIVRKDLRAATTGKSS